MNEGSRVVFAYSCTCEVGTKSSTHSVVCPASAYGNPGRVRFRVWGLGFCCPLVFERIQVGMLQAESWPFATRDAGKLLTIILHIVYWGL